MPTILNGIKVVIVHTDLREAEPMAWDFCMSFAKDNDLQVFEAWMKPDDSDASLASQLARSGRVH